MMTMSRWRTCIAAAMLLVAASAGAQTTGTVASTVRDAQGGVIPGATVTLTSEARATSLPPVVTNTSGDYTFVNVAPDNVMNLPYDANGNPIETRIRPQGAGFGVVTNYQSPRSVQLTARFSF
jgi:hypothetical protein